MPVNPSGLDTVTSSLTTTKLDSLIAGELRHNCQTLVRHFALVILDLAQYYVPVDTGRLKTSLQIGEGENVFEILEGGLVIQVGTSVYYAVFVEFGTRHNAAQPFLTPAVEQVRDDWAQAIRGVFGDNVGIIGI